MRSLVSLAGADGKEVDALLSRLVEEDVLGQLLERRGTMAQLATEGDDVKLDWVDGIAWALSHPRVFEDIERQVVAIRERGIRHVVWSGMGGSIQTVHVLKRMGFLDRSHVTTHPLDSTDPVALNRLLHELCSAEGVPVSDDSLAATLRHTVVIGVSMGMTSEEPITHLEWFDELFRLHGMTDLGEHLLVMTLPGSFLDEFARQRGAPMVAIQPSGESHTPGRMSAPTTRVFLLPATLALNGRPGCVQRLLERCQAEYRLEPGMPASQRRELVQRDPFIRLAAWLSVQARRGRNKLLLVLPPSYLGLAPWVEQVVEESLGKEGRGLLIFYDQDLSRADSWPDDYSLVQFVDASLATERGEPLDRLVSSARPFARLELASFTADDLGGRLALLARFFAGWNLAVAVFGYLNGITFAGQPAVESYKRYARELRQAPGPLPYPGKYLTRDGGGLSLYYGALPEPFRNGADSPTAVLAHAVRRLSESGRLGYLDVTLNAEPEGSLWEIVRSEARNFAKNVLGRPVKVRSGPRDYHATEQSAVDGPNELLSLRLLIQRPEPVIAGNYSHRFLHAQALGTVLAMRDAGRPVLLATIPTVNDGSLVAELFKSAARHLAGVAGAKRIG